jgi:hypothetical protein
MPFGKSKIDINEVINIELEKRKYILWKEQKKNKSSLKKWRGGSLNLRLMTTITTVMTVTVPSPNSENGRNGVKAKKSTN